MYVIYYYLGLDHHLIEHSMLALALSLSLAYNSSGRRTTDPKELDHSLLRSCNR